MIKLLIVSEIKIKDRLKHLGIIKIRNNIK
jgi:hypothetical protein